MTRRVLLALIVIAAFWGISSTEILSKDRPPETELVFLYHSDTKGEIEECG